MAAGAGALIKRMQWLFKETHDMPEKSDLVSTALTDSHRMWDEKSKDIAFIFSHEGLQLPEDRGA